MSTETDYSEAGERERIEGQQLAHLSIEVGHFYMDQICNGTVREDGIRAQFRRVAPLLNSLTAIEEAERSGRARVSTCFLVDDYFGYSTDPTRVLPTLLRLADECGVRIDYLAREGGCAEVPVYIDEEPVGEPLRLAEMMQSRLIPEPDEGFNGRRPPTAEIGWLANGSRSSEFDPGQAMRVDDYRPPVQYNARNHSIFMDVQLWNTELREGRESIRWSCPYLAAIWQLLRLGMIRHNGSVVAAPRPCPDAWPHSWHEMPAIMQLNPAAESFAAYRTVSVLPYHYLSIEHAVRVVMDHMWRDDRLFTMIAERAEREGISVSPEASRRMSHVFIGDV